MARRRPTSVSRRETYFEFIVIGKSVKVSAVDAETGEEVSITGPASAGQDELERVALQKLNRRLGRA